MPGPNRPETQKPLSQTQGFGMVPVYQETRGGRGPLLGYQFDESVAARQGIVETPKPPAVLAEEKRLGGKELEPVYAETTVSRGRGGASETIKYGPPIGYRYDNGKSEYVNFDAGGEYQGTVKRQSGIDPALLAVLAMPFIGPAAFEALGLTGAGAGAAAAAPLAFTPEMIAAGVATPGSIGSLGAASGALTGANLAAASGVGSLGAGAAGAAGLGSSTPITETAAEVLSNTASGAGGYGSGAANPSLLSSAGAGAEGLTSLGAANHLTPAALESLMGTAGYGVNASALEAALAAGIPAAQVGAGALLPFEGITALAPKLTPAAIESLLGTAGYGVNASALEAALAAGIPAAQVGAGALLPFPGAPTPTPTPTPPPQLTPAAIESGLGTPGYGVNASAVESGLFNPELIGAGSLLPFEGVTPTMPKLTPAQIESLAGTPGYGKSAAALTAATAAGVDPNIVGSGSELPFPGVNPTPGITDLVGKAKDAITGKAKDVLSGSGSGGMGLGGALGLIALMSMMNKGGGAAPASTATIPELTATRSQLPYDVDKKGVNPNTPYRPGQGGVTYFSPTTYTPTPPKAAGGGLMSLGQPNFGGYSDGGRLLKGPGDGVSDSIPAIIGKKQPARLADGEFVIPARIVSELGNGSTDAGAKRLYAMMDRIQKVRRKTKNVAANTKASKYLPA